MKRRKKRTSGGPPPWGPYAIQAMSAGEAAPLLWKPTTLYTIPGMPDKVYEYGIPVRVDEESRQPLKTEHTWLTLVWLLEKERDSKKPAGDGNSRWSWGPMGLCKVMVWGADDVHYGAWFTRRTHKDFVQTWYALRAFLWINNAREHGVNGTKLIEYCEATLGAYERDYN